MNPTRRSLVALHVALAWLCLPTEGAAQHAQPARVFAPVLAELRAKVRIPVLVPTRLPARLRSPELAAAVDAADSNRYVVSLSRGGDGSNAAYAGGVSGERMREPWVPPRHPIRLASGAGARFMPVSCGGSCAPANLWWQQDGVRYGVFVKLRSDMSPRAQARILVAMANGMVRVSGDSAAASSAADRP